MTTCRRTRRWIPPVGGNLHIFVNETETRASIEEDPAAYEELWWGKKLVGIRVNLSKARKREESWRRRASKRLRSLRDQGR